MEKEFTLIEALQSEIDDEERRYELALRSNKPIDDVMIIQRRIEYLKVTLEAIQDRYNIGGEPTRKSSIQ